MSHPLISRSADLKRLRDEGYEVEVAGGYLVVHVPYVTSKRQVERGALVVEVTEGPNGVAPPRDHTVYFAGEHPCNRDGSPILALRIGDANMTVRSGLVAKHRFSNKPNTPGWSEPDFYTKTKRYISIICPAAESLDASAKAASFRVIETTNEEDVFMYMDTASSRAGINSVSDKLKPLRVGIIGLGGTGSYILDSTAKCPLKEIRIFDDDPFYSHNAFRAPGAASLDDLRKPQTKVAYFFEKYSKLHKRIVPHEVRIHEGNLSLLDGLDFVFVCVDNGESRKIIFEALHARNIPFVDVGLGVTLVAEANALRGTVRVTTSTSAKHDHVLEGRRVSLAPPAPDDAYKHNIQIGDLNALNAIFAVIKFKKIFGVYQDNEREHHSTYTVASHLLTSDEKPDGT